jgi:hypothetical protein
MTERMIDAQSAIIAGLLPIFSIKFVYGFF